MCSCTSRCCTQTNRPKPHYPQITHHMYLYIPHTHIIDTKSSNKAVRYNLLAIIAASGNGDISVYMKYSTKHRVYVVLFSFFCSSPLYIPTDFLRFPFCNLSTIFFPFSLAPYIPPVSFVSARTLLNRLLTHSRQRAPFL